MPHQFSQRFGSHFQLCFGAFLLRDSKFLTRVRQQVKPEYFSDEALQRLLRIISSFYDENGAAPGVLVYNELDQLQIKGLLSLESHKRINILLEELFALDLQNSEYLLTEFDSFIRQQRIEATLPKLMELTMLGKFEDAESLVRKTFSAPGRDISQLGRRMSLNAQSRIDRRMVEDYRRMWTLIPEIDQHVLGLKGGEIGILQSQRSSIGKTAMLVLFARNFAIQRKNVLYFSLEEPVEALEDRFDQCCGGLTHDELTDKLKVEAGVSRILGRGGVWWAKMPEASTRVSDLKRYAEELKAQENFTADVVLIDYLDMLLPETSSIRGDLFATAQEVCVNWREWMGEWDIGGWSAAQSGRKAAEETSAEQHHVQGGIFKMQAADVVMSLNRSEADEEAGQTILKITKNRKGRSNVRIPIVSDLSRQLIWKYNS